MQAPELVQKLRDYIDNPPHGSAKPHIAQALLNYIEQEVCGNDQESSTWRRVDEYLDVIAYRVITPMRNVSNAISTPEEWEGFYDHHHDEALLQDLKYTIEDVISREAAEKVDRLLNAEFYALMAAFDCFIQKVYIEANLRDHVGSHNISVMFDDMEFICHTFVGRMNMVFNPRNNHDGGVVIFRGEEGDRLGMRMGIAECYTTYAIARERIEEVTAKWPSRVAYR